MSQCQGSYVLDETYEVVVRSPKPLSTRISETSTAYRPYCMCFFLIFLLLALSFIAYGLVWVVIYCHQQPGMALETLSIRNMTAYQTNSTGATQWQVDSAFNIGLSTWNRNTVAGCVTTYRRVLVRMEYRGQTILQQEVPLGFGLQPRRSRPVAMKVEGEDVLLKKSDLGPVMQEEVRSGNVPLDVYFDTRYLRNDRKAGWVSLGCVVVATSPLNSSSSLLSQRCY